MPEVIDRPLVIRWRLKIVMAEKDISNKQLIESTGLHATTVSRLRTSRGMPRLDAETLNLLCKALKCQPGDLMRYEPDEEDIPAK
jgi:putative transcriptional regulator